MLLLQGFEDLKILFLESNEMKVKQVSFKKKPFSVLTVVEKLRL